MFLREQSSSSGLGCMGLAPVPFSPIFASTNKPQIIKKQIPFLLWKIIDQSDKISHLLWQSKSVPFFCGTNRRTRCSSWHKKLQLFFGLLTRTNQTNLVSLGLFCLAGNTWTKIQCPFEGKDKLCLDWHKKLQLRFGFLFMRFLCHFCLARKIRQTWPLTFGRKKLDVLLTENN